MIEGRRGEGFALEAVRLVLVGGESCGHGFDGAVQGGVIGELKFMGWSSATAPTCAGYHYWQLLVTLCFAPLSIA